MKPMNVTMDVAINTDVAEKMTRSKHMALSLKKIPEVLSVCVTLLCAKRSFLGAN